jgi:hypothetical protein
MKQIRVHWRMYNIAAMLTLLSRFCASAVKLSVPFAGCVQQFNQSNIAETVRNTVHPDLRMHNSMKPCAIISNRYEGSST